MLLLTGHWQVDGGKETMEFRSDGTCRGRDNYGRAVSGSFTFIDREHIKLELTTSSVDETAGTVGVDRAAGICKVVVEGDSMTLTDEDGSIMQYGRTK